MADEQPVVYILSGDDDFAISSFIDRLIAKMGDPGMAQMNTTHLDGRTVTYDDMVTTVRAVPFLSPRRLVIVDHPLEKLKTPPQREKFISLLNTLPSTTALVLVEARVLTEERDRRKGKIHWLETWAIQAGSRVYFRSMILPRGGAMVAWVINRAKTAGGQFTRPGAERLVTLIGDDPRLAEQEILKLLLYVNFTRPVEPDDVDALTPDSRQGDIFAMVDALANRDGKQAQGVYHRLLKEQDALAIFAMVVRQFRLLLQTRQVLDLGGSEGDVAKALKLIPFVAGKLATQAQRFSLPDLEGIYHKLLDLDEAAKTGQMDGDLSIDTLIAALAG